MGAFPVFFFTGVISPSFSLSSSSTSSVSSLMRRVYGFDFKEAGMVGRDEAGVARDTGETCETVEVGVTGDFEPLETDSARVTDLS
ncbi:hypothetical protein BKA58DRAFT_389443 [Alternaria rosae]|uniref:uncharacterized protein n=1 Tax=Alternaria rosae TaxID=1187941 RepID=UPI001E8D1D07|nr:uncharacterized protein BKA58DRAFT_389443 [Alternaria rosae]KAH6865423.1 hypothetical protein BKA58DRAFT_389443 [Alternaria rosae]